MRTFVIDAFTSAAFGGNPAGVVLLERPAEDGWMHHVAAELRHSETAFALRRDDATYDLRWFTPTVEVNLCGHATLATTHALHSLGAGDSFTFHTLSGVLNTNVDDTAMISMDFPASASTQIDELPGLADALGATPVSVHRSREDVLVELTDEPTVADLRPNIVALGAVEARGVIVTARAMAADRYDIVSRFFGPRVGVDEDPVTGSAHCALAPFWATRLGRASLRAAQLSARGGALEAEVDGDRVLLRGRAVTIFDGSLTV